VSCDINIYLILEWPISLQIPHFLALLGFLDETSPVLEHVTVILCGSTL